MQSSGCVCIRTGAAGGAVGECSRPSGPVSDEGAHAGAGGPTAVGTRRCERGGGGGPAHTPPHQRHTGPAPRQGSRTQRGCGPTTCQAGTRKSAQGNHRDKPEDWRGRRRPRQTDRSPPAPTYVQPRAKACRRGAPRARRQAWVSPKNCGTHSQTQNCSPTSRSGSQTHAAAVGAGGDAAEINGAQKVGSRQERTAKRAGRGPEKHLSPHTWASAVDRARVPGL